MKADGKARERDIIRLFGVPGEIPPSKAGRDGAHPVLAPVVWVVLLVLGVIFWIIVIFYVAGLF